MKRAMKTKQELLVEIEELRNRLEEAEETLQAIRTGEVDGLVVSTFEGEKVFTLAGADYPYRVLVEQMNEGAFTMTLDGTIMYCNGRFAEIIKRPLEKVINSSFFGSVAPENKVVVDAIIQGGREARIEVDLRADDGGRVPVYFSANFIEMGDTRAICALVTDLTEQKRNEEILKAANLARSILDQSTEVIIICDENGRIIQVSQEAYRHFSAKPLGHPFDSVCPLTIASPSPLQPRQFSISPVLSDKIIRSLEVTHRRDDNKESHFLLNARPLTHNGKGILGCVVSLTDITERKHVEQEGERLRVEAENEKRRLEAVMEALPVGLALTDTKGGTTRFNSAYDQLWRGPRPTPHSVSEYAAYKAWWPETGKPVAPGDWAASQAILKGEVVHGQLFDIQRFDGSRASVINSAAPIFDANGKIVECAVVVQDITQMRKAEEALRNSEERLRLMIETSPVAIGFGDSTGKIFEANESFYRLTGYTRKEIEASQLGWDQLTAPEYAELDGQTMATLAVTGSAGPYEKEYIRKDGSRVPLLLSVSKLPGRDEHIAFIVDITERKRGEETLRKNKERFQLLSETASKLLTTDKPQQIVNDLCQKVMTHLDCHAFFNYLADEEKGRLHLNAYAGIPEKNGIEIEWLDYGVAVCGCAARDACRIVAEDIPNTPDIRTDLVKSFGIKAYACHPLFSAGRVIGTLSFGTRSRTKFTEEELSLMKTVADQVAVAMERIRLVEALRRSRDDLEIRIKQRTAELAKANELLERMFSSVDISIAYMDKDFNFIRVNRAYAQADEREPDFYVGKNHFALFPNEENEQIFRKIVKTGEPYSVYAKPFEYAEHPERGVTHWDWSLQPVKEPDGSMGGVVLSLVNVTERIRAQEAVRAERQRFNDVLEILPAYVVLLTPDYHAPFANRFFRQRFGESLGKRCFEFLFGRKEPCENCETYTALRTMAPHQWEWTGPDGRIYDVFDFPFTDTDGTTLILEMGVDITERKKAEEALRAASLYTRNLIEASLDPLVTISPDGKIMDVNSATELTTGVSRNELIGTDFSDYFTEPEKAREGYQQVFREGSVRDYPLVIRHPSGKGTDVLYHATVFRDEAGVIQGVFAAARDITVRKRGEAALRESENRLRLLSSQLISVQEAERKRIAREIHDSIGQTLAAIKFALESKLSQMSGGSAPPGVSIENIISLTQSGIEESRRIQMDLRPSILDDLGILATIGWFTRECQKVYSHISVEKQIFVEENQIPDSLKTVLFRVMQEAMNNITKHSQANLVRLILRREIDRIEFSMEDNGSGFDLENTKQGLGLTSMRERTELSGGTFAVESTPGAGTTIKASWTL